MGKVSLFLIFLFVLALTSGCNNDFTNKHSTADEVMQDFYDAKDRAEDMLMDPLIVNSDLVKHRVIEEIKNKSMDKRRYAIGYLGNEKIKEALLTLIVILDDESEIDYFRADALESIYQINKKEGLSKAEKYTKKVDLLGQTAKTIMDGAYTPNIRSLREARNGVHN